MAVDDSYSIALLHMNGTDASTTFTDESGKTWTAAGNAQIDTAQSVFGSASGLFDGTGDYIDTPDHADFDVGSGDFTIDFRMRPAAINQDAYICAQIDSTGANTNLSWGVGIQSDESIYCLICSGATAYQATSPTARYAANTWYHIAMVRYGNTITLYRNGTSQATVDVTGITANDSAYKAAIGRAGEYAGLYFNGWVDEFRFSKGIARWTANFTPPTLEYGASAGTFVPKVTIM